jgi:hypothetical protein
VFWRSLAWLGNPAQDRRNPVKYELLKECVEALTALRARMHKELDASGTAELDDVISRLEHCLETASEDVIVEAELRLRTLEILSRCINAATNLAEVVRKLFSPE